MHFARRAWEEGLERAEAGTCSRSPQGTGMAPEPGNAEGCSPTGGGCPTQYRTVPGTLPPARVPRPVSKALGRGAGDEHAGRGRKEAALLGELMGVSSEH